VGIKEWGEQYQKPGFLDRVLSFVFRIIPRFGPFKRLGIKPSTPETELLFMRAFDLTPALRANIIAFLRDTTMRAGTKKDTVAWDHVLRDLAGLRDSETAGHATVHP